MSNQTLATLAPVSFAAQFGAAPVVRVSAWAAPVQGIRMPVPATQLGSLAGMSFASISATANAAKSAYRKDATGDEAFEDPL
jgi:hypothetical protein